MQKQIHQPTLNETVAQPPKLLRTRSMIIASATVDNFVKLWSHYIYRPQHKLNAQRNGLDDEDSPLRPDVLAHVCSHSAVEDFVLNFLWSCTTRKLS